MKEISTITEQTMTSLEVVKIINEAREEGQAELLHKNFMAKVEKVLGVEPAKNLAGRYKAGNGQMQPCYNLPRREANLMVMSESYKVQARIYDRWQELEAKETAKPPIQIILAQAQALADMEQRQIALEEKLDRNAERLDQIETAGDHFTVIGYHRYTHKNSIPLADAARIGTAASKYCRKNEVPMGEVPDQRFGRVKTYPKWVLDEITRAI